MEQETKNQSNAGCFAALAIALAVVGGMAGVVYISGADARAEARAEQEQKRIQDEADAVQLTKLNADIAAHEKWKILRYSEGAGDSAEYQIKRELLEKFGDSYELRARDYFDIYQARVKARELKHYSNRDNIRADELKRYNVNRAVIGLPPVTAAELSGS